MANRKIGQAGLALIKQFEGWRLAAYQCSAGAWTIGYGHTAGVHKGMKLTQAQADEYLKQDIAKFEKYINNPSVFEEVPEDTRLWKPETAPHAIVTNNVGNNPLPFTLKPLNAFNCICGCATTTPTTAPMIIPSSINVVM